MSRGVAPWWVTYLQARRKAVLAAVVALLGSLGTALAEDGVSGAEAVGVALATVVAAAGVERVRNAHPGP